MAEATLGKRWQKRPDGSNWGEFGADDQAGRLNLLTPTCVRRAVGEVREGLTFCLSQRLDRPGGSAFSPGRDQPRIEPTDRNGKPFFLYPMDREKPGTPDIVNDDQVMLATHYSTHWDALCHIGYRFDASGDGAPRDVFYNGYTEKTGIRSGGVSALGIDVMASRSVQTRGVMLDIYAYHGDAHIAVGYDILMRVIEKDGATVEPGDIICLHTGFGQALAEMNGAPDVRGCARISPDSTAVTNACCAGSPIAGSSPSRPTTTRSNSCRHCRARIRRLPSSHCTSIACSSSGFISASSGTSRNLPPGCAPIGARISC